MAERNPWQLSTDFQEPTHEVYRLFGESIHQRWSGRHEFGPDGAPLRALDETETASVLEANVPKVSKQNAVVTVENGEVVLKGFRPSTRTKLCSKFFIQGLDQLDLYVLCNCPLPLIRNSFGRPLAMAFCA